MSKEVQEAKEHIEDFETIVKNESEELLWVETKIAKKYVKSIRTILSELDRLEQRNEINNKKREDTESYNRLILNSHSKTEKELEQKNKVIKLMAEEIDNYQLCNTLITDVDYRQCEKCEEDKMHDCENCIIQYFTDKAKGK